MNPRANMNNRVAVQRDLVLIARLVGLFLCLDLLFALAGGLEKESLHRLDENHLRAIRETDAPDWLVAIALNVTALGSAVVLGMLSLALTGYLALRREWRRAVFVIAVFAGVYALNNGVKASIARARPESVSHLTPVHSLSFPSGHAAAAAAVYFGLAGSLARRSATMAETNYLFAGALVLVVAIGLTRVFLGVHYPSDVLAGWTLGSMWALACGFVADRLTNGS
jgi:undecaprenyl-diphosphatase